jgi:hypothetical protein
MWLCCKKFLCEHWGSKIKYTSKQMPRFNPNSKTYMLKLFSYQCKLDSTSYDIEPRDLPIKFTRYIWFKKNKSTSPMKSLIYWLTIWQFTKLKFTIGTKKHIMDVYKWIYPRTIFKYIFLM